MKNTVNTLLKQKQDGDKITMLTCYDYSTAKLMEEVGVNTILVGDSLGNTMLGYEDTIQVTMEDMIHHCAAVSRGLKNTFLVCDMPFIHIRHHHMTQLLMQAAYERRSRQHG